MATSRTSSSSQLMYRGLLKGHGDWVTGIATDADSRLIISSGRDKQVIVWSIGHDIENADGVEAPGVMKKSLHGHSQTVQDCTLSKNGSFALTASWDKTLRLWDLASGRSVRTFGGHTSDVTSVTFSPDDRQIVSGSRDRTIRVWNTRGECKFTIVEDNHSDWVSCVRFSPVAKQPLVVSSGWDRFVKIWSLPECTMKHNMGGHTGPVYAVTISPDGSLCASGGKDGVCILWDVHCGKSLYALETGASDGMYTPINGLCFSPCHYWLCAATDRSMEIWELEKKKLMADIRLTRYENQPSVADAVCARLLGPLDSSENQKTVSKHWPWATCLQWSTDGRLLFVGSSTGNIYVFEAVNKEPTVESG